MKVSEMRNMSDVELGAKISDLSREILNLRFQYAGGQLENTARLSSCRKEIAKAKTVLRERSK